MYYIGLEDLAANAFIEYHLSYGEEKRSFSYKELENYGLYVTTMLDKDGHQATLSLSRDKTNKVLNDYSDFFEEVETPSGEGIRIKDNKCTKDLVNKFRGYLSLDVLLAFTDEDAIAYLK